MHFVLRRALLAVITLLCVSFFCFIVFTVIPGDPASLLLGTEASAEQLDALREELGLNRNTVSRYFIWLGDFCSGNAGNSMRFHGEPVAKLVLSRLPISISLAIMSLIFILIIAVPVSLLSIQYRGSFMDRIINSIAALGISVPNFFLGILIIWLFGVGFRLFSPGVFIDYRESLSGFLVSLFFPALAITLPNAAFLIKFLRNSMQQELSKDYVRTAFCKGAVFSRIIRHHILPNTLVPLLAIMGIILTEIFSGSIIIEQVFAIPGIGRLLISAIMSRDYPLIQSLVVYIAWTVTLIHAFIDIAVQIIDPRIRLGHSQVKETG